MLPMVGLFRLFPCPYFVVGLCERPHCSFRHCRSDVEAARRESSGVDCSVVGDKEGDDDEEPAGKQQSTSRATSSSASSSFSQQDKKKGVVDEKTLKFEENLKRGSDNSLAVYEPGKRIKLDKPESSVDTTTANSGSKHSKELASVPSSQVITLDDKPVIKSEKTGQKNKNSDIESDKSSKSRRDSSGSRSHRSHSSKHLSSSSHRSHSSRHDKSSSSESRSKSSKSKESSKHNDKKKSHSNKHSSVESKSLSSKHKSTSSSSSSSSKRHDRKKSSSESSEKTLKQEDGSSNNNNNSSAVLSKDSKGQGELIKVVDSDDDNDIELFNTDYPVCVLDSSLVSDQVSKEFLYPSDEESDDESQVALECYSLFQQYEHKEGNEASNKKIAKQPSPTKTEDIQTVTEPLVLGKKRMAHPGAEKLGLTFEPKKSTKSYESPTRQLLRRSTSQVVKPVENSTLIAHPPPVIETPAVASITNKRRIAHVSNASALMKPSFNQSPSMNSTQSQTNLGGSGRLSSSSGTNNKEQQQQNDPSLYQTISQTAAKGERRQAHQKIVPQTGGSGNRPLISNDISTKVPSVVRQKILDQIYQECLKKYSPTEASELAKEEEKNLISKCHSKPVYMSAGVNVITRLRRECREGSVSSLGSDSRVGVVSHHDILVGKSSNISFLNKRASFNPVGSELYSHLTAYLLSNLELLENCYPRKNPDSTKKGAAIIKSRDDAPPPSDDPLRKTCDRCGINYYISSETGFPVIKEQCTYHFGRRYTRGTRTGNSEPRFTCCDGDIHSTGCCTGPCHVFAYKSTDNYVSAVLDPGDAAMGTNPWDVVAIDCEMLYTTRGIELARATFVGVNGKILYDSFVKPSNPILDYNTRFSGITETLLANVNTTLADVQIMVLANLRPNSILIGHSLESDLTALKIIHSSVVDTSIVFPHKRGPPFKRALRNLSAEHLGKIIQNGEGHDSAEDARTALDLMLWKVKHDHGKGPDTKIKGI